MEHNKVFAVKVYDTILFRTQFIYEPASSPEEASKAVAGKFPNLRVLEVSQEPCAFASSR